MNRRGTMTPPPPPPPLPLHLLLFSALLLTGAAGSALGALTGRLLGGENAVIAEHPYQVSIELLGHYRCGGAIVNDRYVVTTAGCIWESAPADLTVRSGSSLRGQAGVVHQVDKVVPHEKYGANGSAAGLAGYDVAVMRVSQAFDFGSDERKPARLFGPAEPTEPGSQAVLTSWGDTSSLQMQLVRLAVLGAAECAEQLAARGAPALAEAGQICTAAADGKAACSGDRGSPLAVGERLAGMAAWGFECGQAAGAAVFTEIGYFRDWIDEHAAF